MKKKILKKKSTCSVTEELIIPPEVIMLTMPNIHINIIIGLVYVFNFVTNYLLVTW